MRFGNRNSPYADDLLANMCGNWQACRVDWERLGRMVAARRVALGYERRDDFADARGLGSRTLGEIERGDKDSYRKSLLARVEIALGWAPGSIDAVLVGGEPTTFDQIPLVLPPEGMDPIAAEIVYVLSPESPVDDMEKESLRMIFGELLKRARMQIRSAQRQAGGD